MLARVQQHLGRSQHIGQLGHQAGLQSTPVGLHHRQRGFVLLKHRVHQVFEDLHRRTRDFSPLGHAGDRVRPGHGLAAVVKTRRLSLGQVTVRAVLCRHLCHAHEHRHQGRGDRPHGRVPHHPQRGVRRVHQRNQLPIARGVAREPLGGDGPHHILKCNFLWPRRALSELLLHPSHPSPTALAIAVHRIGVEHALRCVVPTQGHGRGNEVRREQHIVVGLRGNGVDVTRTRNPDAVGPQTLGHPQAQSPRVLQHHPSLVRIGDEVRIAAVARVTVLFDQGADQVHALTGRPRALQHQTGQVGVVRAGLVFGRHGHELGPGWGPDVAHSHPVFVQAPVGDGCGHAQVVAVADPQVTRGLRHLSDGGSATRQLGRGVDADHDRGTHGV